MPLPLSNQNSRFSIRQKILLGFGFVLLMMGVIAVCAFRSTKAFIRAAEGVAQSRQILELEASLDGKLVQAENCVRGYSLSGEDRYLKRFEEVQNGVGKDYASLHRLTSGNSGQKARVTRIEPLIHRKIELLRQAIATRKSSGIEAAAPMVVSLEIAEVSRELEQLLKELDVEAHRELEIRSARTEIIARTTTGVIVFATLLTVLLLLTAAALILKDIAARHRAEEALLDEHHLLRSVMDAMPDQVYVTDFYGHCIIDNAAHREFMSKAHLTYEFDVSGAEGDLIRKGSFILNCEEPLLMPNGEIKWLSRNKIPLRDTDGNIIGMVGVISDISERKAGEEKLRMAARQMERSNRDLQDFASVASHDLQEPLRKILAFGDRLRVKCDGALGENGRDYLERMTNAAQRMQKLIQSLLTLSRVTSKAMPFEQVDLKKLTEEVVSDLEVRIEQSGAVIDIGNLPTIEADPQQMRQLFQNLIANALKFQVPNSKPVVSVSGKIMEIQETQMPGAAVGTQVAQIRFTDNGIGFDQKFAERIFVVFQRLHGRLEYEGTGIGLAVCRRITERHGGLIQAKSEEGAGATFIVTLPVKQLMKEENYETR